MAWLCRNCEAWHSNDNGRICEVCQDVRLLELPAVTPPVRPAAAPPRVAPPALPVSAAPPPRRGRRAGVALVAAVLLIVMVILASVETPSAPPVPDTVELPSPAPSVEERARHIDVTDVRCRHEQFVSCGVVLTNNSPEAVAVVVQSANGRGSTSLALPDGTATSSLTIAWNEQSAYVTLAPGASKTAGVAFPPAVATDGMTFTLAWTEYSRAQTREQTQSIRLRRE